MTGYTHNVVALHPGSASVSAVPPENVLDTKGFGRIERLRYFANCYALHPQGDWEQACRVIAVDPGASLKSHAFALLGALDAYALRPIVFYQRGAQSLSEGEVWMGRLLAAVSKSNDTNVRALMSFRLPLIAHRRVAFLATALLSALVFEQNMLDRSSRLI